jgi:two-component system, OmpR family, response regulator
MEPSGELIRLSDEEGLEVRDPLKILVVEDEPRLQRSLARALREANYAVDTAADGEQGCYKAESADYNVVILDVMMPRMNGWQVLARLRQTKQTPVLMLTARDLPPDRVRGLDLGADDYVVKPFDLPELLARVRALIRRSVGRASSLIQLEEIELDTCSRTVTRDGKPVTLTAREFAILEYLALHRGKVVSRTELYEHLVDENDDALSNLLDVHVFAIRKKLRPNLIVTRRGQGYSIE